MDFNSIWQQHKRFLVAVGTGLIVFLIGGIVVDSLYGGEVRQARTQLRKNRQSLAAERYGSDELSKASAQNEALTAAVESLASAAAFEPRPEFRLDPASGSASNQYFARVDRVREELVTLASRNRLRLPADLGLEMLKTTRSEIIERHLEALDVIDRLVRLAVELGIERIDKIQVRLDPGIDSRQGIGPIERTRVTFQITSAAQPVVEWLSFSQSERVGAPIPIEDVDLVGARSKEEEVRATITFLVVRLHETESDEEDL